MLKYVVYKDIYARMAICGRSGSKSRLLLSNTNILSKVTFLSKIKGTPLKFVKDFLTKLSILIIFLALELFLIDSYRGGGWYRFL